LELSGYLRLSISLALLLVLLAAERGWPRRSSPPQRLLRWTANISMVVIASLLVRVLLGAGAVGAAYWAAQRGWGLLPWLEVPRWLAVVVSLLLLDLLIYGQHRLFHYVPLFWRLHRVHHSDTEFDATTALRFHPAEILLSMLIKIVAVVALGAPAMAVLAFEVILNATAMFNHANLRLPAALDRALRWVLVTPDMHRVHHSVHVEETNSNYGFNLPWWDRLFGSYRAQPRDGHTGMEIGLHELRARQDQGLAALLRQPLRKF